MLNELNTALSRIQDEDKLYNQLMYDRYVRNIGTNAFLAAEEAAWLKEHGPIRVGYQNGFLPFCDTDPKTGELTGTLKEYLELASHAAQNVEAEFPAVPYPTTKAALDALLAGEIDCVFPIHLNSYEEEEMGISVTNTLMDTEIYAEVERPTTFMSSPKTT